jgi:hypothetical protein
VAYITGLISVLFGSVYLGYNQASRGHHLLLLIVGPVLIIMIAQIGVKVSRQVYERFLDAITMRAKIEQLLGLTKAPANSVTNSPQGGPDKLDVNTFSKYWENEPIVPTRNLISRNRIGPDIEQELRSEGSYAWTKEKLGKGYNANVIKLFRGFQLVSVLVIVMVLLRVIVMVLLRACK